MTEDVRLPEEMERKILWIINWTAANFEPETVYSYDRLKTWAMANGFVLAVVTADEKE
jgi:hypothetical protein